MVMGHGRPGGGPRLGRLVFVAVLACALLLTYVLLRVGPTTLAGNLGIS